jgi:hypothetical protein
MNDYNDIILNITGKMSDLGLAVFSISRGFNETSGLPEFNIRATPASFIEKATTPTNQNDQPSG